MAISTLQAGNRLAYQGPASGTALGNSTVWPQVANWDSLGGIDDPRTGDRATVLSLGAGSAFGVAQYSGSAWQLDEGVFDNYADLLAFADPIRGGAFAGINEFSDYNPNAITYVFDGAAWKRFVAGAAGVTWSISNPFDLSPTGSFGTLKDGDFGIIGAANGPILLRFKAACPIAAGGTRGVWMTPSAYAGTPVLQMWTDGTEDNATLAAQGWTLVLDAGCSVTATSGFQRLLGASGAGGTAARLRGMVGAVAAGTRVESIFEARASTPATSTLAVPFTLLDGTNGDSFGQTSGTGVGFRDFAFGGPLQTPLRNGAAASMPALASAASIFVLRDEGRTVLTTAMQDGVPLGDYRRNLQSSAANLSQAAAQGASGGASTLDFRGQVITY